MFYKLSQYNYIKIEEKIAIYNTFSGGLAILEKREYHKLQNIQDYSIVDEDIQTWLNLGFVVDAETNEYEIVKYCRYRDTFIKKRPIYRILTTSGCNACCFYCYEQGQRVQTMSKETAIEVANFIIKSSKDKERITINWFGGEPLLNPGVITLITEKVQSALDENEKSVNATMITNASLFTKELIGLAKDVWNLSNIQISLDGLKECHEKRKAYTNKRCSFKKTIEIINSLLTAGFHISLRLNYDKENFDDIINLIYYIKEIFGNLHNLTCYAYPLFNINNDKNDFYLQKDDIPIYESRIKDALIECGYYNPLQTPSRRTIACFATEPYSCVINPKGIIYKCTMDMADETRSIGNVKDGFFIGKRLIEWTTPDLPDKCQKCFMLPICQGGCRAARLLNINMNDCAIKKQSIDYMLYNLLKNKMI